MVLSSWRLVSSSTETVEAMARALQSVDNVQRTNGLPGKYVPTDKRIRYRPSPFIMISIGHGVSENVLKENLEGTTCFLVNAPIDALHATTTGNTAQRRFGDG